MARPPKDRVFCIGFNKCGTSSLHHLFRKSGLKSLHCVDQRNKRLAALLMNNLAFGRRAMAGSEDHHAFSDISLNGGQMFIEGCRFFKKFHEDYPDAFFILNTRDCDAWIRSRLRHNLYNDYPTMIDRAKKIFGLSEDEVVDQWRALFRRHHEEVRAHFAGYERFIEFDIENDAPEKLRDFLAPAYRIKPHHWVKANSTDVQQKTYAAKRLLLSPFGSR